MLRAFFGFIVILLVGAAISVAVASPKTEAGIDEKIGVQVPVETQFRDEQDKPITLRECIAGKPTILVPMYYRCPMNCHRVVQNLMLALNDMPKDFSVGSEFNVICVSFDPKEHASEAKKYKEITVGEYKRPVAESGWRFLTGTKESIAELMQSIGFRAEFDKAYKEYNHPNGSSCSRPRGYDAVLLSTLLWRRWKPGEKVKDDGTLKVLTTTLRSRCLSRGGKGGAKDC